MEEQGFGLSSGYCVVCSAHGALPAREAARHIFGPAGLSSLPLRNGGRLHLNATGQPEYATPECDSVPDLVVYDKAGERLLEGLLERAGQREYEEGAGCDIHVYKTVSGAGSSSFGCRESYLIGACTRRLAGRAAARSAAGRVI